MVLHALHFSMRMPVGHVSSSSKPLPQLHPISIDFRKLAQSGAISLAIRAMSSFDLNMRALAYTILGMYYEPLAEPCLRQHLQKMVLRH